MCAHYLCLASCSEIHRELLSLWMSSAVNEQDVPQFQIYLVLMVVAAIFHPSNFIVIYALKSPVMCLA